MVESAILYEGKNDKEFIETLINDCLAMDASAVFHGIFGSKAKFFDSKHTHYQRLKKFIEAEQIEKILFIIDADDSEKDKKYGGFENTQRELTSVIEELGFQAISEIYITCNPETKTGYLESLILSTISPEQRQCIECFLQCSHFESKEHHKAIFNQIYKLAYPQAPYNFEHPHFDELKQKINLLNLPKTNA